MSTLVTTTVQATTIQDTAGANSSTTAAIAAGIAKAWVNFNGTGTVTIRTDYNVNTIGDNGVGDYTMNFSTALTDTDFCVMGLGFDTAVNRAGIMMGDGSNNLVFTTTPTMSVRFRCYRGGSSTSVDDSARMCLVVFR